jgi:TolA-binding protein
MADRQHALERRLEQLEARLALSTPRKPAPEVAVSAPQAASSSPRIPKGLRTVTLRPEPKAAPPVATAVELKEPEPEVMDQILSEPETAEEKSEYGQGMTAISTGDVERGVGLLVGFADKNKRSELAPTALFTAGIGLQNWGEPAQAALLLTRVADDYPLAAEAPEAMVRLAECQLKLKNQSSARAILSRVVSRYPNSKAAKVAENELKGLGAAPAGPQ